MRIILANSVNHKQCIEQKIQERSYIYENFTKQPYNIGICITLGNIFYRRLCLWKFKNTFTYPTQAPIQEADEQVMNPEPMQEKERYEVIAENGRLCLYKTDSQTRTLITGEDISIDIFPYDDVQELKNGVFFDDLASAQAMFENFVS